MNPRERLIEMLARLEVESEAPEDRLDELSVPRLLTTGLRHNAPIGRLLAALHTTQIRGSAHPDLRPTSGWGSVIPLAKAVCW